MKKGFLVTSITLVLSSSLSNTVFAFPFTSFVIEPIVTISDTLSAIPPKPLRMANAADMNERVKEDIIEPYERYRLEKLFGYDHRGSSLENHLFNEFNGME